LLDALSWPRGALARNVHWATRFRVNPSDRALSTIGDEKADRKLTFATAGGIGYVRLAKKPAVSSGFSQADEGTRTLDLLHGKQML
jgi:hypothetical protein